MLNQQTTETSLQRTVHRSRTAWLVPAVLLALGLLLAYLYLWAGDLHRFTQGISAYIALFVSQFAIYLLACYAVLKRGIACSRWLKGFTIVLVLGFGLTFRAELVARNPYLSTDAYRYVWDGRVQSRHINPYRYAPRDPRLVSLRDPKVFPNINGNYERTPYPPAAEMIYLGLYEVHPSSVDGFKTGFVLCDVITILALMGVLARAGLDPARALIYAWHPLIIWEGAHSGHVDVVFIMFLTLALLAWSWKKPVLTGVALALASLVKLYPILLLPLFLNPSERFFRGSDELSEDRQSPGRIFARGPSSVFNRSSLATLGAFVTTVVVSYLPYLTGGDGALTDAQAYLQEEGFVRKGGRYLLLGLVRKVARIPTPVYIAIAVAVLVVAGLWWLVEEKISSVQVARGALVIIGLYLLLTTPRYPWYFCWLVPFLCFIPEIAGFYLTGATVLLYTLWFVPNEYPNLPIWLGACLYLPPLVFLARKYLKRREQDTSLEPLPV